MPKQRYTTEEIIHEPGDATVVVWLPSSQASYITDAILPIDGGFTLLQSQSKR